MTTITEEATEAVRVRELDWRELTEDRGDGTREPNGDWEATSILGIYTVDSIGDGWVAHREYHVLGTFDTPDEAKAAAQSDYEARIRSALVSPQAEGRDTGATAAIVEKLTSMARLLDTGPVHGPACAEIVREAIRALSTKEPE